MRVNVHSLLVGFFKLIQARSKASCLQIESGQIDLLKLKSARFVTLVGPFLATGAELVLIIIIIIFQSHKSNNSL